MRAGLGEELHLAVADAALGADEQVDFFGQVLPARKLGGLSAQSFGGLLVQDEHRRTLPGDLLDKLHQVGGAVQVVHLGNERAAGLLRGGGHRVLPLGVRLGGAFSLPAHNRTVRAPRQHAVHAQLGGGLNGEQVATVLRERLHQVDVRAGVFLAELLHAHDDAAVGQGVHGAHGTAAGAVAQVDALPHFHALDEGVLALGAVQLEGCAGGEGLVLFGADVEDGGAHGAPWVLMGGAVRRGCEARSPSRGRIRVNAADAAPTGKARRVPHPLQRFT